MEDTILEYIRELNPYEDVDSNTELFEEKILDSLSLMALVNMLESEYDIEMDIEEITKDNFNSVISIARLIERKFEK